MSRGLGDVYKRQLVQQTASELRQMNSKFQKQVNDLEASKRSLDSKWDGEANEAFNRAFMEDKGYMTQFFNVIQQYCQALETIVREYNDAERRTSQIARERTARK